MTNALLECQQLVNLLQAQRIISKNLDGVLAPGVFIDIIRGKSLLDKLTLTLTEQDHCIDAVFEIVELQGRHLKNPYHNTPHFREVYQRALLLVKWLKTPEDRFAVRFAAPAHDYDHPGNNPVGTISIRKIVELYNGEYTEAEIRQAYVLMIELDNALIDLQNSGLPEDEKKPMRVFSYEMSEIELTPEEISALYADAWQVQYCKKIGKPVPLSVRARVNCLIKATDFGNKRNFPKTPMEWQFKLADMGNFLKPMDEWLRTSVNFGLEAPWGPPASVEKFIDGELFFFKTMVNESMLKNSETEGLFPHTVYLAVDDKVAQLEDMKSEIEKLKKSENIDTEELSNELINLRRIVRPLFKKIPPPLFV
jgi:hypothetical protein